MSMRERAMLERLEQRRRGGSRAPCPTLRFTGMQAPHRRVPTTDADVRDVADRGRRSAEVDRRSDVTRMWRAKSRARGGEFRGANRMAPAAPATLRAPSGAARSLLTSPPEVDVAEGRHRRAKLVGAGGRSERPAVHH